MELINPLEIKSQLEDYLLCIQGNLTLLDAEKGFDSREVYDSCLEYILAMQQLLFKLQKFSEYELSINGITVQYVLEIAEFLDDCLRIFEPLTE